MKKIAVGLMLILFFHAFIDPLAEKPSTASEKQDLMTIMSLLEKNPDIEIRSWSLHAREKLDSSVHPMELQEKKQFLLKKFSHWNWKSEQTTNGWEMTAVNPSTAGFEERIRMAAVYTKSETHAYIIYEAEGNRWNKETKRFVRNGWPERADDIFRENATIFTCVTGQFNDKIKSVLCENLHDFLHLFQAKEVESAREENFLSVSAYSRLFSDFIYTNSQPINLQLGIRSEGLGARTTFVVGTPIITIEY